MGLKLNGRCISLILAVQIGKWPPGRGSSGRVAGGGAQPPSPKHHQGILGVTFLCYGVLKVKVEVPLWVGSLLGCTPVPPNEPNPSSLSVLFFVCLFVCCVLSLASYWEDFHSCTVLALTDCQEGAKDMWDKLRKESKNLNIQGSLFELCGSGTGAAGALLPALAVLLAALSAALATWLCF
ncbi:neuritin [Erinaceus europaeus]|uniref:Neuritin n=1 Tax=Erinaceus europaeus TaxID=9365 RepID=A0ABM3XD56_ERIEU|nr:neuritin [Erinaceus europaeus]